MSETPLLNEIRKAATLECNARLFRNNVGIATYPGGEKVAYGLQPGSSDLIGWRSIIITPDMVGQRVAIFASIEAKAGKGVATKKQIAWLKAVDEAGGIAGEARSAEDAVLLLTQIKLSL